MCALVCLFICVSVRPFVRSLVCSRILLVCPPARAHVCAHVWIGVLLCLFACWRAPTARCFDLFVQSQFPFPLLRDMVLVSRVVVCLFLSLVCWFVVLLLCCSLLVVGLLAFVVCVVACLVVGLFVRLLC